MTGFARLDGETDTGENSTASEARWTWEMKSVNGRGLEVRFRLPSGFDALEPALRKILSTSIKRGSVTVSLNLHTSRSASSLQLNEAALGQVLSFIDGVRERVDCAKPQPENILNIRGVVEQVDDEVSAAEQKELGQALEQSFKSCVDLLSQTRTSEGEAMARVIGGQIETIGQLTEQARRQESASIDAIRQRLELQIKDLIGEQGIEKDRLAQEVALMTVKADIREELDRLDAHVAAAQALLKTSGVVGRKLDFLTQEFNREANTLCSKAPDMELKNIGLELKTVIDQMREQVQNVE